MKRERLAWMGGVSDWEERKDGGVDVVRWCYMHTERLGH